MDDGAGVLNTHMLLNVSNREPMPVGRISNLTVSFDEEVYLNFRTQSLGFLDLDGDELAYDAKCNYYGEWTLPQFCFHWLRFKKDIAILTGVAAKMPNQTVVEENGIKIYKEDFLFRVSAYDIGYLEADFEFYVRLRHTLP